MPVGGTAGQVLTKNSGTNYDTVWQTPSGGLTLPLSQHLTFAPDATYDVGLVSANRPRNVYLAGVQHLYNPSAAGATDYQRLRLSWGGSEAAITAEKGGASGTPNLALESMNAITFRTGSTPTSRWTIGGLTGHLTAAADNTYDIGSSGALRPRNIYVAGGYNAPVGPGSLSTLGDVSVQRSATTGMVYFGGVANNTYLNCTGPQALYLSSNFYFAADNTYDIGASGASRARDLYLARHLTMGGTLTMATGPITLPEGGYIAFVDSNSKIQESGRHFYFDTYNANWYWRNSATGSSTSMSLTAAGALTVGSISAPVGGVLTGSLPNPGLAANSVSTAQIAAGAVTTRIAQYFNFPSGSYTGNSTWIETVVNATGTFTNTGEVRVDYFVTLYNTAVGTVVQVGIGLDGTVSWNVGAQNEAVASGNLHFSGSVWYSAQSGSHRVSVFVNANAGTTTYNASVVSAITATEFRR